MTDDDREALASYLAKATAAKISHVYLLAQGAHLHDVEVEVRPGLVGRALKIHSAPEPAGVWTVVRVGVHTLDAWLDAQARLARLTATPKG